MPTTDRSGVTIHFEVTGSGPPLVFLHGLMGRLETWRMEGYAGALARKARLILVDARGHGLSERRYEAEAYRPACHAADVLAVLDELELERAALVGWGMGAGTALRLAATHPHRVDAVAALGPRDALDCVGFSDLPAPDVGCERSALQFEGAGVEPVVRSLERAGLGGWAALVASADPLAMAACVRGFCEGDPVAASLADLELPLLFAWGEMEAPVEPLALPAHARVVIVPEADQLGAFRRSDLIAPGIARLVAADPAARNAHMRSGARWAPARSGALPR